MSRAEYLRQWRAARKALGRAVPRGAERGVPSFVAWDGEGETVRQASGAASDALWRAMVRSHAQELLDTRRMVEAPFWTALDEHGGRITPAAWENGRARGEYDDLPRHLRTRPRGEGNADKIGQAAGTDAEGLLAFFRDHPRRPSWPLALADARAELDDHRPRPPVHNYALLANSRDGAVAKGDRLDTPTILDALLAGRQRHPQAVHAFFGGSYDATMALKDLSHADVERLWRAGRHPVTVLEGRYAILYRPRRSLYVARWGSPRWLHGKPNYEARTQLWDVWGFFQASFVKALADYGFDPELVARIEAMKARRPTFSYDDRPEVERYCLEECRLLEELLGRLAASLYSAGLKPRAWNGAGAVAAALLGREGVKAAIAPVPDHLEDAVRRAYFGGRIELCRLGWTQGPVELADIVSAYPWATAALPDLRGSWEPTRELAGFGLYRVSWAFLAALPWYPLPYRQPHGSILFPAKGEGWYWLPEVLQALAFARGFGGSVEVREGWALSTTRATRPFAFVPALYAQRKAWQKELNGAEKAAKLGLNSLYGKMAQQLGGDDQKLPPYFSLAWAGWVTSATRARLVEAALPDPSAVVAFSTDGIATIRPLKLPDYGDGLGSWGVEHADDAAFAQAGVYWLRRGRSWKAKYRGFDREGLEEPHAVLEAWARGQRELELACTRFVGLGSALCSKELWAARGTWRTVPRVLDLTGASAKRIGVHLHDPAMRPLPAQWNIDYDVTGELSASYRLAWEPPLLDGAPEQLVEQELHDSFA